MLNNHPRGVWTIFMTEIWERFGFYILMAVLTLYMDKSLQLTDSQKGNIYGLFLGAAYFIPLFGGWLGDNILGQVRTVKLGAVIMAVGYTCLGLSSVHQLWIFYLGLAFIAFGTGIFKVNMSVMVGNLYRERPELKDTGYNLYYMSVNVGATIAPLAATLFSALSGSYKISFWAAAMGLMLAVITMQLGQSPLKFIDNVKRNTHSDSVKTDTMNPKETLERIVTLIILFIIVIFFWMSFYQNGFAMTLFAERSTIKHAFLKPETYQFFNPFFILILTPIILKIFSKLAQKGKEPSTPMKIFLGMIVMGIAMAIMVWASKAGGNSDAHNMSPLWLINTYFVVTLAEILISPMGQSFVSKVAPPKYQGLLMGGWFLATSIGSAASGFLGKFYGKMAHSSYFILLGIFLLVSAVLVQIFMKKLKQFAS